MNHAISPFRLKPSMPDNNRKIKNQNISLNSTHSPTQRVAFSGNIQKNIASGIANSISDKFFKNKFTQAVFKLAQKDVALFDAFLTFGIVSSIRPLTIMATPGASKDDKQYAAVKAAAGGIIGLGLTALLFTPVTKAVQTAAKEVFNKEKAKSFEYIMNYGSKFIVAPLQAILLVEMMHPLMNLFFPRKKKVKLKPEQIKPDFSQLKENINPLLKTFEGREKKC